MPHLQPAQATKGKEAHMNEAIRGVITAWEGGDLSDERAAYALAQQLGETEDSIKPLEAERDQVRKALDPIIRHMGGACQLEGFGTLQIVERAPSISYDREIVEALIIEMAAAGASEWAATLANARRKSKASSSLRVTRERGK